MFSQYKMLRKYTAFKYISSMARTLDTCLYVSMASVATISEKAA